MSLVRPKLKRTRNGIGLGCFPFGVRLPASKVRLLIQNRLTIDKSCSRVVYGKRIHYFDRISYDMCYIYAYIEIIG